MCFHLAFICSLNGFFIGGSLVWRWYFLCLCPHLCFISSSVSHLTLAWPLLSSYPRPRENADKHQARMREIQLSVITTSEKPERINCTLCLVNNLRGNSCDTIHFASNITASLCVSKNKGHCDINSILIYSY